MPPLTQLYAATGRQVPRNDEAVIQASIPNLYASRARQIQAENLALARREQELSERQGAEQAQQMGRATTIQSLALIPPTLTSIEAIKPARWQAWESSWASGARHQARRKPQASAGRRLGRLRAPQVR